MIAVGDKRAKIVHGDNHPAAFYKGDKLISGYQLKDLQGSGNVGIDAPYDAVLKSVSVDGLGEQDSLVGKNFYNIDAPYLDMGNTKITKNGNSIKVETTKVDIGAWLDIWQFYKIKKDTVYTFSVNIDYSNSFLKPRVLIMYSTNGVIDRTCKDVVITHNGSYSFYIPPYKDYDELAILFYVDNAKVTSDSLVNVGDYIIVSEPQLELGNTATPYEPYCGAMPAPNPVYPIQPQFLEGASLVCRGKNLCDFLKKDQIIDFRFNGFDRATDVVQVEPWMIGKRVFYSAYIDNTQCSSSAGVNMWFKDRNDKYIHLQSGTFEFVLIDAEKKGYSYHTFTITEEMYKLCFGLYIYGDNGPVYLKDRIAVFGDKQAPYELYYDGGTAQLPILRALPNGVHDEVNLRSGVITRRVVELELTSEKVEKYDYQNKHGVVFYNSLDAPRDRTEGLCTHENNIGFLKKDREIWIGAYDVQVYWVGILDALKLETVVEFRQWLDNEKAKGTPVTIWYALETPTTEQVAPTLFKQHPGYTQLIQQGGFKEANIKMTAYEERD